MPETISLQRDGSAASISALGAEPVAWSVGGRDLLWSGDAAYWARISPVLFPIVGRARDGEIRVGGKAYPMDIHGFAPASLFAVAERSQDHVRLVLSDNEETHRHFPFSFRLKVTYRLSANALMAEFLVTNPGDGPLPFALGFHPGFRWPFGGGGKEGYQVAFEEAESAAIPIITRDGLFSQHTRQAPLEGAKLPLGDDLLAREALCFLDAKSRWLRFIGPEGSAIRVRAENFAHWALWSRPGAGFLCIEAWTGYGDPEGFSGDITDKPSMRFLAPGAESRHRVELGWEPRGS